jgi:hypothetical protein
MRGLLLTAVGATLLPAAALAQANIPRRYSGSFPSDGVRKATAGTPTGKHLTLLFRRTDSKRLSTATGSQLCPPM